MAVITGTAIAIASVTAASGALQILGGIFGGNVAAQQLDEQIERDLVEMKYLNNLAEQNLAIEEVAHTQRMQSIKDKVLVNVSQVIEQNRVSLQKNIESMKPAERILEEERIGNVRTAARLQTVRSSAAVARFDSQRRVYERKVQLQKSQYALNVARQRKADKTELRGRAFWSRAAGGVISGAGTVAGAGAGLFDSANPSSSGGA